MTLRFSTSRAIGAAIALTLGSAAAGAQTPVRKDVPPSPAPSRRPVTKDTPTPAPAPDTTSSMPMPAPAPAPTPAPVLTDTMSSTTTTTTTTVSTGEVPPVAPMRMGSNWSIGVAGAAAFPQNRANDFYRTGWGVEVPITWQPQASPLGLRVNLGYTRLRGETGALFNGATQIASSIQDPQIFQGVVDAKLRLPIGNLLSGLYAVGGGGVYYFRNYANTLGLTTNPGTSGAVGQGSTGGSVTNTFSNSDATRFGANVGGGVSFGVGSAALFVESRYVRVFTPNTDTDYVPVALGVTLHW